MPGGQTIPGKKTVRRFWAAVFSLFLSGPLFGIAFSNDYRSPRNVERPIRAATRNIVLHTTEAPAKSSLNKLSERGECHYCVTEDGTVYRIIDRDREAYHAGRSMWNGREDCDNFSIGIEVVGHHDKPVTLSQLNALRDLLNVLKTQYHVPDAQIVCHSHVAYGAPNTWYKRKHRGRKRCGMIFAMPSVRAKLGLRQRPAVDPDVRAGRLIQADGYLNAVLYGSEDTMAATYGRPRAVATVVRQPAVARVKPAVAPQPVARKPAATQVTKGRLVVAAVPVAVKPASPASEPAFRRGRLVHGVQPVPAKPVSVKPVVRATVVRATPPPKPTPAPQPVVKAPAPSPKPSSPPPEPDKTEPVVVEVETPAQTEEESSGVISGITGFFKHAATLRPFKKAPLKTGPLPVEP